MKYIGLFCAAAALVLAACQKHTASIPDESPTEPPAAPTPQFAPPGVFYLLAAAHVETSDGVTGLPPGTEVKLVRPGIYRSRAGDLHLKPSQVTNDMTLARTLLGADRNSQAALQAGIAARANQSTAMNPATPMRVAASTMAPPPVQAYTGTTQDLDARINSLQMQITAVRNQIANVDAQIAEFNAHTGQVESHMSRSRARRVSNASTLPDQKTQLESQLIDLQNQLSQAQQLQASQQSKPAPH